MGCFRHSPVGQLLLVWIRPRLLFWMAANAVVMTGAQCLFRWLPAIPHYLGFNPGIVLLPLAAIFWGPAGVWAAVAASVAGDWACGLWGPLTPWRAAGVFFAALSAQQLWDFTLLSGACGPAHLPRWGQTFRFLIAAWPGALIAATWCALGSELNRLYPFPYYFSLLAAHHLLFITVLGVAFYRVIARELIPWAGDWRELSKAGECEALVGPVRCSAILLGALGAPVAGVLVAATVYHMRLFEPFVLGTRCGPQIPWAVLPFLALLALALLVPCRAGVRQQKG